MTTRKDRKGLRRACKRCPPSRWAKCTHGDWHGNHRGWRGSLAKVAGRPLESKTDAEEVMRAVRAEIDATITRVGIEAWRALLKAGFRLRVSGRDEAGRYVFAAPVLRPTEDAEAAPTVEDVTSDFLRLYVRPKLRPRAETNVAHLTAFLRGVMVPNGRGGEVPFTEKPFREVTTEDVERVITAKAEPRTAIVRVKSKDVARTVGGRVAANRLQAHLTALWNWAIKARRADRSPFEVAGRALVSRFKEHKRNRRLEAGEEERLLVATRTAHTRDVIVAALETGCRKGELLSLQWSEVSWDRNEIRLLADKTKTDDYRIVPISAALRDVLLRRLHDPSGRVMAADKYVFGNEIGERIRSFQSAWDHTLRRAGIEGLTFHDLRREAASRKLELARPWPLHAVSAWLGHSSITMTARYLDVSERELHRLNERDQRRFADSLQAVNLTDLQTEGAAPPEHLSKPQ